MPELHKPSTEDLNALAMEALAGGKSVEAWTAQFIEGNRNILKANPRSYRGYGPFWWLIKKVMIDRGVTDVGDHVDAEGFAAFDYGDTMHNLLAAFLYNDYAVGNGLIYASDHTIGYTDGEQGTYTLCDEDMERRAAAMSA